MSSTNTMRLTKSKPNFSSFHGSSRTFNNSPMPLDLGTLHFLGAFPKSWTTTFGQLREAADGLKESVTLAASCARFCRWKACQSRSSANRPVLRALLRRDHTEQCEKRPVHSFPATVRIFSIRMLKRYCEQKNVFKNRTFRTFDRLRNTQSTTPTAEELASFFLEFPFSASIRGDSEG